MPFLGEVVVSPIPPEGKRWKLVQPLEYQGRHDLFTVPAGFETDFASVPRLVVWLLPRYGRWTPAAILHDYLWHLARSRQLPKVDADAIFNRALRELKVPFLRRWLMWTAVRWAAGPSSWLDGGIVSFAKMVVIAIPALALVAIPAFFVLVAIIIGGLAELIAYLPLRVFHRTERKEVNAPEVHEVMRA